MTWIQATMNQKDFRSFAKNVYSGSRTDNITSLNFNGWNLSQADLQDLGQLLSNFTNLQQLRLRGNSINASTARAFSFPSTLKLLDIGNNNLGDEGAEAICKSVPRTLQILLLDKNGISANGARGVADNFPPSLRSFFIGNNPLGSQGVCNLAHKLPQTLEFLGMQRTEMGNGGAVALASQMPRKLRLSYLSTNSIGVEGGKALARNFPSTLEWLEFHNNPIGEAGQDLAVNLSRSLKLLYVDDCCMGTAEKNALFAAFHHCQHLQFVNMMGNLSKDEERSAQDEAIMTFPNVVINLGRRLEQIRGEIPALKDSMNILGLK